MIQVKQYIYNVKRFGETYIAIYAFSLNSTLDLGQNPCRSGLCFTCCDLLLKLSFLPQTVRYSRPNRPQTFRLTVSISCDRLKNVVQVLSR